ncbi:T9SS type A sorting domain-containing protein [candidate division KSB1 bacterium]|nr:T9SS type A sorting domain-containing protein [candidate division KSB1 bacterium]
MRFRTLLLIMALLSSTSLYAQLPGDSFPDENSGLIADFSDTYTWTVFDCADAATFEIVDNPDGDTYQVGKVITTDCTWEGVILEDQQEPFDFSVHTLIKVQVYSPEVGRTVAVKIQPFGTPNPFFTVEAQTTVANAWETLIFDFADAQDDPNIGTFDQIALFPDYGEVNVGESWYFTNVQHGKPPISIDENNGVLYDFDEYTNFFYFWGEDASDFAVIDNPYPSGINTSEKVGWFITSSDCSWEGFGTCNKYEYFDFDRRWVFKVLVYAPDIDRQVTIKLEKWEDNHDNPTKVNAYTTVAEEWEELTFDVFEGTVADPDPQFYDRFVIQPDYQAADGDDEWLIDNVRLVDPDEDTSVESPIQVNDYKLAASNYPNPFNPTTTISYTLPVASDVQLTVYDILGNEVMSLVNENKNAGVHHVTFDGMKVSSGIYFYRLEAGHNVQTHKMMLLK